MPHKHILLELDDLDFDAVQRAIAKRQNFRVEGRSILPDGDSNTAGAVIAEICRGWAEFLALDRPPRKETDL